MTTQRSAAIFMACIWLLFTVTAAWVLLTFFRLTPEVGPDFFFSSDNPKFLYSKLIDKMFPQQSSQIIISAQGDITSDSYYDNVSKLTDRLTDVDHVTNVKSIAKGPKNIQDALESPLWNRLLISDEEDSTNILVFLEQADTAKIIPKFEHLIDQFNQPGFALSLAGVPYVVEMIRRNLQHDFKVFTSVAFVIFGIVIILIFRSLIIFIGTFITCVNACLITLLATNLLNIPTGVITVNLATIVFVITLSHIVFIIHNRTMADTERPKAFAAAKMTFNASFWCMVTTLLGFVSLIFVQAKPLRQLGISGSIGTVAAILAAYGMYPFFLQLSSQDTTPKPQQHPPRWVAWLFCKEVWAAGVLILMAGIAVGGIGMINDDPSIFSYFKKGGELRNGLEYIDRNGGSSPLNLVIRDTDGNKLNNKQAYNKLWKLMHDIEDNPNVGSVISLPVIMAEGNRAPLSFLLSWENLLKIMELPMFNEISERFITKDRISGHFFLRMKESQRTAPRSEVIRSLTDTVQNHGFITEMKGGLYYLQGEMSKMVSSSLIYGIGRLLMLFGIIALIASQHFIIALCMVLTLCITPLTIFGLVGYTGIPVDIISAPAANVAIAMGIDSMIHMSISARRKRKQQNSNAIWNDTRNELWKPVVHSMLIICAGFGIFALSSFPPTQRFGLLIVFGTIIAALGSLFVLPWSARIASKKLSQFKRQVKKPA